MNFSTQLSTPVAITMGLLAASMWGTWFISLKYMRDYPLDAFFVTLFATSLIFVWSVGWLLDKSALFGNIGFVLANDPLRVWFTLGGGILYAYGMRFSLTVMRSIGLALTQPIQSAMTIVIGNLISSLVGGLPSGVTIVRILFAACFSILAVFACMLAARWRNEAQKNGTAQGMRITMKDMWRAIGLLVISTLMPGYVIALSYGLASTTHSQGLAVMPFMALLATGAFIGSLLGSGVGLTRSGQWHRLWQAGFETHKFGIFSGLFHYGGNIIHTFATSDLGAGLSWPLGITAGMWTQVWGLVYGEFKDAPRRAYLALLAGFLFYLIGAYIIASARF
jgi:drug/metabolite transporter (DMT)-like permease